MTCPRVISHLDAALAVDDFHMEAAEDAALVAPVLQLHARVACLPSGRPRLVTIRHRIEMLWVRCIAVLHIL